MDKFVKVDILKHSGGDCSNHGVTSRVNETILFANGLTFAEIALICQEQGFDIHNALQIVTTIYSSFGVVKYAKPVELLDRHTMFGGCFAYTCNAPFARMLGEKISVPIKILDRVENLDMGGY